MGDRPPVSAVPRGQALPRSLTGRIDGDVGRARAPLSSSLSPRVSGLLALAGVGMVAALLGRPELAVLATPLLVFVGVGLALAHEPQLEAEIGFERTRLLEGEQVRATVTLRNNAGSAVECDLALARTSHIELEPGVACLSASGRTPKSNFSSRFGRHVGAPTPSAH